MNPPPPPPPGNTPIVTSEDISKRPGMFGPGSLVNAKFSLPKNNAPAKKWGQVQGIAPAKKTPPPPAPSPVKTPPKAPAQETPDLDALLLSLGVNPATAAPPAKAPASYAPPVVKKWPTVQTPPPKTPDPYSLLTGAGSAPTPPKAHAPNTPPVKKWPTVDVPPAKAPAPVTSAKAPAEEAPDLDALLASLRGDIGMVEEPSIIPKSSFSSFAHHTILYNRKFLLYFSYVKISIIISIQYARI